MRSRYDFMLFSVGRRCAIWSCKCDQVRWKHWKCLSREMVTCARQANKGIMPIKFCLESFNQPSHLFPVGDRHWPWEGLTDLGYKNKNNRLPLFVLFSDVGRDSRVYHMIHSLYSVIAMESGTDTQPRAANPITSVVWVEWMGSSPKIWTRRHRVYYHLEWALELGPKHCGDDEYEKESGRVGGEQRRL